MTHHYKAKQLATQANINTETLRYYEEQGLWPLPQRADNGYRLYTDEHVEALSFIKRAQHVGFSLKEIKTLLALKNSNNTSALEVHTLAQQKIKALDEQIEHLQAMKTELSDLTRICQGEEESLETCPIMRSLSNNSH
jgi:MerR family transcriptional regulator, copper efflux regulator